MCLAPAARSKIPFEIQTEGWEVNPVSVVDSCSVMCLAPATRRETPLEI